MPFQRPAGIATYATYAANAHLPFAGSGLYKDKSLTDPSIFDFYNQLLDGPNKWEWQNFRAYNLGLDQTFFHDRVGFQATYNKEWYKNGNVGMLAGEGAGDRHRPEHGVLGWHPRGHQRADPARWHAQSELRASVRQRHRQWQLVR